MDTKSTALRVIDPQHIEIIPAPTGLPEKIASAYSQAMIEVENLVESVDVQRRFAHLMLTQLRTNTKLQQCTVPSIVTGIVAMAQQNLDPSSQNECWLIPYNGEATMQIGYAGLIKLALSHPDVLDIFADEVCEQDTYEFYGVSKRPLHIYPRGFKPRGMYLGYYAVALLTNNRERAVQMSVAEIKEHAKRYSRNAGNKIWSEGTGGGFQGMSLKTVLRKICNTKFIPMTGKVAALLQKLDTQEAVIDGEIEEAKTEERKVIETGKSLADHIEDVTGQRPVEMPSQAAQNGTEATQTSPAVSPSRIPINLSPLPTQPPPPAPSAQETDRLTLVARIESRLGAAGQTAQQQVAWRGRMVRKYSTREVPIKSFEALPVSILTLLLEQIETRIADNRAKAQAKVVTEPTAPEPGILLEAITMAESLMLADHPLSSETLVDAVRPTQTTSQQEAPETVSAFDLPNEPEEPVSSTDDASGQVTVLETVRHLAPDLVETDNDWRAALYEKSQGLQNLFLRDEAQDYAADANRTEDELLEKLAQVLRQLEYESPQEDLPF